jgi:hypothetical protein
MARGKKAKPITAAPRAAEKPETKRLSNAERSAHFSRREAAKVLRTVLEGDARRRAVGSIKSLIYRPSIRNKKGTFALVCQTLKRKFSPTKPLKYYSTGPLVNKCNLMCWIWCRFQIFPLSRTSWRLLAC